MGGSSSVTESPERHTEESLSSLAGKYLSFVLKKEHYGIPILRIQEIFGMLPITRMPNTPSYIRGVINLRGRVIPVVDIGEKLGMSCSEVTFRSCIIVVQVQLKDLIATMGIIVDEVSEVVEIKEEQLEAPPNTERSLDAKNILAMGKLAQCVIILLDIDTLLAVSDFSKGV